MPQIVDKILALPDGARILMLGPLIRDRKTEGDRVFEAARKQGFVRVRVDGEMLRPGRGARRSTSTSATRSRWSSTGSSSITRTTTASRTTSRLPEP